MDTLKLNIDIYEQDDQAYLRISLSHFMMFGEKKDPYNMSVAELIAK